MSRPTSYRGRFAPSPTGDLHWGSVATAVVTWLAARQAGGALILRVEDLDEPRVVPGALERQLGELEWLGLDWDEGPDKGGDAGPYRQSECHGIYANALERLAADGHVFYCDCSRAEIARTASAPHAGEALRYPGTCRSHGLADRPFRRPPAIRLAVPNRTVEILDRFQGRFRQDLRRDVGDFVLRRGDGVYAYHLAVVVDDLRMGVTEVVRGADLLSSSPQQAVLTELLGGAAPTYAHSPLVLDAAGERLAKRSKGVPLRDQIEAGRTPQQVLAAVAGMLGIVSDVGSDGLSLKSLLEVADLTRLGGVESVRLPEG